MAPLPVEEEEILLPLEVEEEEILLPLEVEEEQEDTVEEISETPSSDEPSFVSYRAQRFAERKEQLKVCSVPSLPTSCRG